MAKVNQSGTRRRYGWNWTTKVRPFIMARDPKCIYCEIEGHDAPATGKPDEVDHVIPWSSMTDSHPLSDEYNLDNLARSCYFHNRKHWDGAVPGAKMTDSYQKPGYLREAALKVVYARNRA